MPRVDILSNLRQVGLQRGAQDLAQDLPQEYLLNGVPSAKNVL
jgi:hypothetical protein